MMLLKQFMIDARFGIKAFRPCFAHHGDQVLIAGVIFAQEHEMAALAIERIYFIIGACVPQHRPHIQITGLNTPLLRGTIKTR